MRDSVLTRKVPMMGWSRVPSMDVPVLPSMPLKAKGKRTKRTKITTKIRVEVRVWIQINLEKAMRWIAGKRSVQDGLKLLRLNCA